MEYQIRKGQRADIPQALALVKELAAFEQEPNAVEVTVDEMERDGFGKDPAFELIVAEETQAPHPLIGMALYYFKYSTWKGRALYLEDIVVTGDHRRKGVGAGLFETVILEANRAKVRRMEWQVLDWNRSAIRFYERYNAHLDHEWVNGQLPDERINEMARKIGNRE